MQNEFFPFSILTAEGQAGRQSVAKILRTEPQDVLGTILLRRIRSKLEVLGVSSSPEAPSQGMYESTRYESGIFIVRAIRHVLDIQDGDKIDTLSASGGFTHIKPTTYNPASPLIPGELIDNDTVNFNVAELYINDLSKPGPLSVQLRIELGGEEPYEGVL